MSRTVDHVFCDIVPQKVVVAILDNDLFNGAFRTNPFQFQKLQDDLMRTLKNNEPVPNRPYQTNFPTEGGGQYITVFHSLSTDIAGGCYDHGNAVSRKIPQMDMP